MTQLRLNWRIALRSYICIFKWNRGISDLSPAKIYAPSTTDLAVGMKNPKQALLRTPRRLVRRSLPSRRGIGKLNWCPRRRQLQFRASGPACDATQAQGGPCSAAVVAAPSVVAPPTEITPYYKGPQDTLIPLDECTPRIEPRVDRDGNDWTIPGSSARASVGTTPEFLITFPSGIGNRAYMDLLPLHQEGLNRTLTYHGNSDHIHLARTQLAGATYQFTPDTTLANGEYVAITTTTTALTFYCFGLYRP